MGVSSEGVTEHMEGLLQVVFGEYYTKTWRVFVRYYKHRVFKVCVTNMWRVFIECYSTQGGSSEGNIKHIGSLLST